MPDQIAREGRIAVAIPGTHYSLTEICTPAELLRKATLRKVRRVARVRRRRRIPPADMGARRPREEP